MENDAESLAIVGMACRWPGADTPSEFWDILRAQQSSQSVVPSSRFNIASYYHPDQKRPGTVHCDGGYFLKDDVRDFDPTFFGIGSKEAMELDPQQRKLLETVYEAMESSGITLEELSGSLTGCFVGNFTSDYQKMSAEQPEEFTAYQATGTGVTLLSNRVSYCFNLKGPSLTVDTACSSALYALHLACTSIRNGECTSAVVGGTNLILNLPHHIGTAKLGVLSPTSTCHTFDESADGYARADGIGAIIIKPLKDALRDGDPIRAVIKATAFNANGRSGGLTTPSVDGQEAVIRQAYKLARMDPVDTGYFECHGTGTPVGDPIEVEAVGRVFAASRDVEKNPLFIGSVKTNIGHSEAASGLGGLMKAVLALENKVIPPVVGLKNLNSKIDFRGFGVEVVTKNTHFPPTTFSSDIRRASINSFGFGGANAHVILESSPSTSHHESARSPRPPLQVLPFSANCEDSLKLNISAHTSAEALGEYDISDLAYTLSSRRSTFFHRGVAVVSNTDGVAAAREVVTGKQIASEVKIGFVFSGQGAQWPQMGKQLMELYPVFNECIDDLDQVLTTLPEPPNWTIRDTMLSESPKLIHAALRSQTVCTALQLALYTLLKSWNIRPTCVVGHSSGEIAAAFAAGKLSMEQAITAAYYRGHSIGLHTHDGAMLAVGLSADEVEQYLIEGVEIACVNSSRSITLSGRAAAIREVRELLDGKGIFARELKTDGNAYHSANMKPVGESYEALLSPYCTDKAEDAEGSSEVLMISSVTGTVVAEHSLPAQYWRENLEGTVQFSSALQNMLLEKPEVNLLIELGPHAVLKSVVQDNARSVSRDDLGYESALLRGSNKEANLLAVVGKLWIMGYPVDLNAANQINQAGHRARTIPNLPRYNWNYSKLYWSEPRISVEKRELKFPRHALLGSLELGACAGERRVWRNVIRTANLPWLLDHLIEDSIIYPGSAYIAMSIAALSQVSQVVSNKKAYGLRLDSLEFKDFLSVDVNTGAEIMFHVQPDAATQIHSTTEPVYRLSAVSLNPENGEWTENFTATGTILLAGDGPTTTSALELDTGRLRIRGDQKIWYEIFAKFGLNFGPSFKSLRDLETNPDLPQAASRFTPFPDVDGEYYPFHPVTIDGAMQLGSVAAHWGDVRKMKYRSIPRRIASVSVQLDGLNSAIGFDGRAVGESSGPSVEATSQLLQDNVPVFAIHDVSMTKIVAGTGTDANVSSDRYPYMRTVWKPDVRSLSLEAARALFPSGDTTSGSFERACHNHSGHIKLGSLAIAIFRAKNNGKVYTPPTESPYLTHYVDWLYRYKLSPEFSKLSLPELEKEYSHTYSQLPIVEAEVTNWVHERMDDVLSGKTSVLQAEFESGLLTRVYAEGQGSRPANVQLANIVDLLAHETPTMRIAEIGAGTGSVTDLLLEKLGAGRPLRRFEQYVFTDIGQSFVTSAKERWGHLEGLDFKLLNVENDADAQGLEHGSFDLIIAANVLHVTTPLSRTLGNARKMLKQGGRLVLLETTYDEELTVNFFLGTIRDWWIGRDDGRIDGPCQNAEAWRTSLKAAGFSDFEFLLEDYPAPAGVTNVMVTRRVEEETRLSPMATLQDITPPSSTTSESGSSWDACSTDLVAKEPIYLVYRNSPNDRSQQLRASLLADLRALKQPAHCIPLLSDQISNLPPHARVISLVEVNGPFFTSDITPAEWLGLQTFISTAGSILWLTTGNSLSPASADPDYGVILGWSRSVRVEHPGLHIWTLDLESAAVDMSQVILDFEAKLVKDDVFNLDFDFVHHDGVLHVSRLHESVELNEEFVGRFVKPANREQETAIEAAGPIHVEFEQLGVLDSAYFQTRAIEASIGETEVEVAVKAWSLSLKGVLSMMGKFAQQVYTFEGAGVVTRVGSGVRSARVGESVFFLYEAKMDTVVRFEENMCCTYDDAKYTHAQMSTLPVLFPTAIYSLLHQARLTGDDTILIHSAAGGLGLAAIQIAKSVGATIYATVGTAEKRKFLTEKYGIPDSHMFSSRGGFREPLLAATNGVGVDVVMNTLTGSLLHESLECCAPFARFLELGMKDLYGASSLDLSLLSRSVSFMPFTMLDAGRMRPDLIGKLLKETMVLFRAGAIAPIDPIRSFDISKAVEAARYFMQPSHIGKVVLTLSDPKSSVMVRESIPATTLKPDVTYIIVGGFGGLGKSMITWLAKRNAKHILVISRSATISGENEAWIKEIFTTTGCQIYASACDIANLADVQRTREFAESTLPPVRGIIHSAMCLRDYIFTDMKLPDFNTALGPKVHGTRNLHTAFGGMSLDFFVICSSVAAIAGTATQSNYAGANSFQDTYAQHLRAQGAPVVSVNIGMVGEVGYIARNPNIEDALLRNGIHMMYEYEFHHLLEVSIRSAKQPDMPAGLVTGLEPERLRELWRKGYGGGSRWTTDRRVAAIIAAATRNNEGGKTTISDKDRQLEGSLGKALSPDAVAADVVKAIVEKMGQLLLIKPEDIDPRKAPVDYGIDSMVGAEFRHWLFGVLKTDVGFRELLSPETKIVGVAERCWESLRA